MVDQEEEDVFVWKKSKTDNEKGMEKHISKMLELEREEIGLKKLSTNFNQQPSSPLLNKWADNYSKEVIDEDEK